MEWDEYLDDGAFYREALDLLIREDNEFDPEPYEPLEHDRYDDNDNEEEEAEYDDYEEEEEEGKYEEREEDDEADEEDEDDENEAEDDEDSDDVNEEEYNEEEEEARAFHKAVKKQKEEWQRQMQGDGLPESIFMKSQVPVMKRIGVSLLLQYN